MTTLVAVRELDALAERALEILEEGKNRARSAVEYERVRTYWALGREIAAHLDADGREEYGAYVVGELEGRIGLRKRVIYEVIDLYRTFPIVPPGAQLSWSHYRRLLGVGNLMAFHYYSREAESQGWGVRELQARIRADAYSAYRDDPSPFAGETGRLRTRRGRLYHYQTVVDRGRASVDLGFEVYREWEAAGSKGLPANGIVRSDRRGNTFALVHEGSRSHLYMYRATLINVIDGDTIRAKLDLGFQTWTRQKLRLRGIDTPELWTRAGQVAKAFVVDRLENSSGIAVRTTRPDKYGRYLADVFYSTETEDPAEVAENGRFLNGELVKEGMARVV